MRSYQFKVAALVPDKKLDHAKSFPIDQNNLAYHPGPVSPPGGDGSPFRMGLTFCVGQIQAYGLGRRLIPAIAVPYLKLVIVSGTSKSVFYLYEAPNRKKILNNIFGRDIKSCASLNLQK